MEAHKEETKKQRSEEEEEETKEGEDFGSPNPPSRNSEIQLRRVEDRFSLTGSRKETDTHRNTARAATMAQSEYA